MSVNEVLHHLSLGHMHKSGGSYYIISYEKFKRLGDSLEHYFSTGELVDNNGRAERGVSRDHQEG